MALAPMHLHHATFANFVIGSRYLRDWYPVISSQFPCREREGEHGEEVVTGARRIESQKRERWEKHSSFAFNFLPQRTAAIQRESERGDGQFRGRLQRRSLRRVSAPDEMRHQRREAHHSHRYCSGISSKTTSLPALLFCNTGAD